MERAASYHKQRGRDDVSLFCVLSEDGKPARGQQRLEARPLQSGVRAQAGSGEEQQPGEGIQIYMYIVQVVVFVQLCSGFRSCRISGIAVLCLPTTMIRTAAC